jgi:hypothetical protein
MTIDTRRGQDLMRLDLQTGQAETLVATDSNDGGGQYSKDGRWIAYWSQLHVWIRPADGPGGPWQVDTRLGAAYPRWRADQSEIFYLAGNTLMVTSVKCEMHACTVGATQPLFDLPLGGPGRWSYDVSPDGQHFVVIAGQPSSQSPLQLVVNWANRLAQ